MSFKLLNLQSFFIVLSASFLQACVVTNVQSLEDGLGHKKMPYKFAYLDQKSKTLLPESWVAQNDPKISPYISLKKSSLVELEDQNGKKFHDRIPLIDMVYDHQETNGKIYLLTRPLQKNEQNRKMPILLRDLTESLSGGFLHLTPRSSGQASTKILHSKHYATSIASEVSYPMDGAEAILATIEVANSDQLKLDPNHRWKKLKVLMVRPEGYPWVEEGQLNRNSGAKPVFHNFRGLIILIYEMDPLYYGSFEADFDHLISRLSID